MKSLTMARAKSDRSECNQVQTMQRAQPFCRQNAWVKWPLRGLQSVHVHEMQMEWLGCQLMRCILVGQLTLPMFCWLTFPLPSWSWIHGRWSHSKKSSINCMLTFVSPSANIRAVGTQKTFWRLRNCCADRIVTIVLLSSVRGFSLTSTSYNDLQSVTWIILKSSLDAMWNAGRFRSNSLSW